MEEHRSEFRVAKIAEVLKVSRSGFYAYLNRTKSKRSLENERLLEKIKKVYQNKRGIYGYPRITDELKNHGAPSHNRVYTIMKQNGIRSKTVKNIKQRQTQTIIFLSLKIC